MTPEHAVHFTSGSPETVLDPLDPELAAALDAARSLPPDRASGGGGRRGGPGPALPAGLGGPGRAGRRPHRPLRLRPGRLPPGLDALRAAGWRGSGYVRWRHEPNRGFLRSLHMLQLAAGAIGEVDEEQRCDLFLRQLDPEWELPGGLTGRPAWSASTAGSAARS